MFFRSDWGWIEGMVPYVRLIDPFKDEAVVL
jgi:hypothetical protein